MHATHNSSKPYSVSPLFSHPKTLTRQSHRHDARSVILLDADRLSMAGIDERSPESPLSPCPRVRCFAPIVNSPRVWLPLIWAGQRQFEVAWPEGDLGLDLLDFVLL